MAQPKGKQVTMIVVCAWCKKEQRREVVWVDDLATPDPMISHGICQDCLAKQFPAKPKGAR